MAGGVASGDAPVSPAANLELLLVATLVTGLTQKLAVLFLRHPLTTLLDDRTHYSPLIGRDSVAWTIATC
jgi:hypothetical protein